MFNLLHTHIEKRVHISDEEFEIISKFFIPKKMRKKQFLLHEGEVCKNIGFVNSGCLREYTIDNKGSVHIIQFAINLLASERLISNGQEQPCNSCTEQKC